MRTLDEMIIDVVDLLGYDQDKAIFTYKFQRVCLQQALTTLVDNLPDADRAEAVEQINALDFSDPDDFYQGLCRIFSEEALEEAVTAAMIEDMDGLLESVSSSLSQDRQAQIHDFAGQFFSALA